MVLSSLRERLSDYITGPPPPKGRGGGAKPEKKVKIERSILEARAHGVIKRPQQAAGNRPNRLNQHSMSGALGADKRRRIPTATESSNDSPLTAYQYMGQRGARALTPEAAAGQEDLDNFFNVLEEKERRQALDAIDRTNWTAGEVQLLDLLSMRGFEPMLPTHWRRDFQTMPEHLFTDNLSQQIFHAIHGSDFRGKFSTLAHRPCSLVQKL